MAEKQWRTSPDHENTGWPKGVPYIVGNEASERFSFYGMRAILVIFMTKYLMNASGELDLMIHSYPTRRAAFESARRFA